MNTSPEQDSHHTEKSARKLTLSGLVQGVGFRPFIYLLATQYNLTGWVKNCVGRVEIHVQGHDDALQDFVDDTADRNCRMNLFSFFLHRFLSSDAACDRLGMLRISPLKLYSVDFHQMQPSIPRHPVEKTFHRHQSHAISDFCLT